MPEPSVDSLVAAVIVHEEYAEVGEIVNIEELTQRRSVAPAYHLLKSLLFGFMEAADKSGEHMAVGGMIVVVGAVEVGRHHRDVVGAILTVEIFAILQTGYFCQA